MSKFSKFLHSKETVTLVAKTKKSKRLLYFLLFLLLLAFFFLIPMWKSGRQGLWIWLGVIVIIFFLVLSQLTISNNLYILTNQRVVYLKAVGNKKYTFSGGISLHSIKKVTKVGKRDLKLVTNKGKYYLSSLINREKIYNRLNIDKY